MARFDLQKYWNDLKESNPKRYEAARRRAARKAAATRKKANIKGTYERRVQKPENWGKQESISKMITRLTPERIANMSRAELLDYVKQANTAIEIRESDFLSNIRLVMNDPNFNWDFHRENFSITDETGRGKLIHILRMQQRYLQRNNTYEDYAVHAQDFQTRVIQKTGIKYTPKEELETERKFWKLYKKALEAYNAGGRESRGSPIMARLISIFTQGNIDLSVDEILQKFEYDMYGGDSDGQSDDFDDPTDFASFVGLGRDDLI